ncbi:MAG: hypothetical protein U0270_06000 [Labilithrix sp.]
MFRTSLALLAFITGCTLTHGESIEPLKPTPERETGMNVKDGSDSKVTGSAVEGTAKEDDGTVAEASAPPPNGDLAKPITGNGEARCDRDKPFARPELVASVSTPEEEDVYPVLSSDELQIWFTRLDSRTWTGARTFTASRRSTAEAFGPASPLTVIAGASRLSILGSLTFADVPDANGLRHLHGEKIPSLAIGGRVEQAEPYLPNESAVYFTGNDSGPWRIQRVALDPQGLRQAVLPTTEAVNQVWPVVSADELTIWYAGAPVDLSHSWDVMTATRPSKDVAFGASTTVVELSGPTTDLPSWISADGCTMALSSNRANDSLDLYIAHRPK